MRRKLLTLFAITAGICSLVSAKQLIGLLFTDYLYQKDFVQFFLMGHALRAGANLYAPLPQLAAQFDPNLNQWLNVSAYPPIVAVIGLPLSYLPYFWSVIAWLMFELVCLAAAIMLIVKQFGGRAAATPVLIVVAAFIGWRPVYIDLYLGQLMIPILLLLTLCWLALKAEKDVKAGLFLGIVIAIKLYAWPIALFLLLKGRWRAPVTAFFVFVAANALMVAWTGSATVYDYYSRVGGSVLAEYTFDSFNYSAWCVGYRSFGTSGGILVTLAILLYSMFLAFRSKNFDTGFMVMLTAATILQPLSWIHYMITLLPVFCFIANRRNFLPSDFLLGATLLVLILPGYFHVASSYPALAAWPPLLFTVGLMWLIVPKPIKLKERSAIINAAPTVSIYKGIVTHAVTIGRAITSRRTQTEEG